MQNIIKNTRYGRLVAVKPIKRGGSWEYVCDCGNVVHKKNGDILNGNILSCGCLQKETRSSRAIGRGQIDLSGKRYSFLTVVRRGDRINGRWFWVVKCDCGTEKQVRATHLSSGKTKSCGCKTSELIASEISKHLMSDSTEYNIWTSMKSRCLNPNNDAYKHYGGRGITICDRWLSRFENFYSDMGKRPDGRSLDRINNDGNYEPSNCRWATYKQQRANSRGPHKRHTISYTTESAIEHLLS